MTKNLTPADRVRRRFLQGRTAARDVTQPVSAIAAAGEVLEDVRGYISEKEPTLLPLDNVGVWVVCVSSVRKEPFYRRVYPEDRERIRALLDTLMALPDFRCIGLTFFIREISDDGSQSIAACWIKPFLTDDASLTVLDRVLKKQVALFGTGWTQ